MSDHLAIYNAVRAVPDGAKRQITAGRLSGKTDINPMWRIKALTEQFGPCGIGWKYTIDRQWIEAGANGETSAFCNISLYIKSGELWSEAIPGTGGSAFVANERSGPYTSDECYKMALTDAISVACKALGFGANVYWEADCTKYGDPPPKPEAAGPACEKCGKAIAAEQLSSGKTASPEWVAARRKEKYGKALCAFCAEELKDGA